MCLHTLSKQICHVYHLFLIPSLPFEPVDPLRFPYHSRRRIIFFKKSEKKICDSWRFHFPPKYRELIAMAIAVADTFSQNSPSPILTMEIKVQFSFFDPSKQNSLMIIIDHKLLHLNRQKDLGNTIILWTASTTMNNSIRFCVEVAFDCSFSLDENMEKNSSK